MSSDSSSEWKRSSSIFLASRSSRGARLSRKDDADCADEGGRELTFCRWAGMAGFAAGITLFCIRQACSKTQACGNAGRKLQLARVRRLPGSGGRPQTSQNPPRRASVRSASRFSPWIPCGPAIHSTRARPHHTCNGRRGRAERLRAYVCGRLTLTPTGGRYSRRRGPLASRRSEACKPMHARSQRPLTALAPPCIVVVSSRPIRLRLPPKVSGQKLCFIIFQDFYYT